MRYEALGDVSYVVYVDIGAREVPVCSFWPRSFFLFTLYFPYWLVGEGYGGGGYEVRFCRRVQVS